jgi:hypothetical protein
MAVFWDVAPCSLVEIDRRFRGAYRLRHQGDEDRRQLHARCCENLKSQKLQF